MPASPPTSKLQSSKYFSGRLSHLFISLAPSNDLRRKKETTQGEFGICVAGLSAAHLFCVLGFYPTGPITILEPRDQEIGEFYVVQERHETDYKAKKSRERASRVTCLSGPKPKNLPTAGELFFLLSFLGCICYV